MGQHSEREEAISVIVGLGNPGRQYELTRHNAGFRVVDRLAGHGGINLQERKFRASWGSGILADRKVLLLKPLTFMNRSGEAVSELLAYFDISANQMMVVHDDLDLPCGRLRLARRGGAGGHRGVLSILDHLKDPDFVRLKLGIGRPVHGEPVEAYVLDAPYAQDVPAFEEMITHAEEAVQAVLSLGLAAAMNRYNKREPRVSDPAEESG